MRGYSLLLPAFLFCLTVLSRIPFTSKFLYHMDSGHFALALEKYDIAVHQPHPPGYFLYVILGRIGNLFIGDANAVFVVISILFSGLTVAMVYCLGKEIYDRRIGFLAAAVALTSPNFWFHGEVALSYAVEAFFSAAVAFLCWKIYKGEHRYIWLSAITLAAAGGIRQNTLIFLFPLWLFSVKRVPVKMIIASIGLLGLGCILWFAPMLWMTGGWSVYRTAFRELWLFHTGTFSVFENGWASLKLLSSMLLRYTLYGIGAGVFVLGLAAYSLIRNKRFKLIDIHKVSFFSFWALPSILFYLLVFISNPGYVLIFLPALFILIVAAAEYISDELRTASTGRLFIPILLLVMICNTGIFLFSKFPVSHREIRNHDTDLTVMLGHVKKFDPARTAVFVGPYTFFSYRHVMYYLPEYRVYQVDAEMAPTGETRKTFWGMSRKTSLSDGVILPEKTDIFISLLIPDDRDRLKATKGIDIANLNTSRSLYIASGDISLLRNIYPDLKVRQERPVL